MAKLSFSEKLKSLFGIHKNIDEDFFEELTDALIEGDIGAKTTMEIVDALEKKCCEEKITDQGKITEELGKMLLEDVKQLELTPEEGKVNVYMVLGVNGVGKTTSVAKMAKYYSEKNIPVIMAAADTFRLHRKTYVKLVVAGKGLKLFLALDPKDYKDSPIPVIDVSEKNAYVEIPLAFKVKSDLSRKRAKQLIADAMAKDGIEQGEVENVNYVKQIRADIRARKQAEKEENN